MPQVERKAHAARKADEAWLTPRESSRKPDGPMLVASLRAARGAHWSVMTVRLAIVVAIVGFFAWSFSTIAQIEDATIRPENARVACGGLGGDNCSRPTAR